MGLFLSCHIGFLILVGIWAFVDARQRLNWGAMTVSVLAVLFWIIVIPLWTLTRPPLKQVGPRISPRYSYWIRGIGIMTISSALMAFATSVLMCVIIYLNSLTNDNPQFAIGIYLTASLGIGIAIEGLIVALVVLYLPSTRHRLCLMEGAVQSE
jgi:hypothetical protein